MSQKFLSQFVSDVFDSAYADTSGSLRLSAVIEVALQRFEDAGVLSAPVSAFYCREGSNLAAEVHAYAFDDEDDVLALLYVVDATADVPLGLPVEIVATGKDLIDRGFRRLESFVRLASSDRLDDIDESQPVSELAGLVRGASREGNRIELWVVTTGTVSDRAASSGLKGQFRREIWDLVRLSRICGDRGDGAISIDFNKEFGAALPCLVSSPSPDGLRVLLTTIPGQVLADIYNTHRASLLERNVRSFLQFTGGVNKGIRATILNQPHRFLPFNNGLSATAGRIELELCADGVARLRSVHDFQIVNGGQTTASIAACARRDKADLSAVVVPMKLTVVPPEILDGLVPEISRFANTQNRIQDSDFSANDPWHIAMERHSRAIWTSPRADAPRGTRWFYERSRGQYSDGLAGCPTQAGKRQYRTENPPAQKFGKTDVAKFLLSWDQMPAVVSRGAQKCFHVFKNQLGSTAKTSPLDSDFRRVVALGILFRTVEDLYDELGFQGFRANVVTYSIARLSNACRKQLDFEQIWKDQAIPGELRAALKYIIVGVREVIFAPPAGRKNSSEWSKSEDCWTAVLGRVIDIPGVASGDLSVVPDANGLSTGTPDEHELVEAASAIPAEVWLAISSWAAGTATLQAWQRKIAYSLGRLPGQSRRPSIKQARQGRKLLLESVRVGFSHVDLGDQLLARLRAVPDST